MHYIRLLLCLAWFVAVSAAAIVLVLFRWGDLNLDRDIARMYASGMLRICNVRVRVSGADILECTRPAIVCFNHQSAFDIATFGSMCPARTLVIGKKELAWYPFFNIAFVGAGNVLIDRGRRDSAIAGLSRAVDVLRRKGATIWIAPEGTRNRSGRGLLPFKKGAFHMAIDAQVPIVPVVCATLAPVIDWKRGRLGDGEIPVRILPAIPTIGLTTGDVDALGDRVRAEMLGALSELRPA
jgi:1-acyl-sn-glycerol-3-phosphate acyltransferase